MKALWFALIVGVASVTALKFKPARTAPALSPRTEVFLREGGVLAALDPLSPPQFHEQVARVESAWKDVPLPEITGRGLSDFDEAIWDWSLAAGFWQRPETLTFTGADVALLGARFSPCTEGSSVARRDVVAALLRQASEEFEAGRKKARAALP